MMHFKRFMVTNYKKDCGPFGDLAKDIARDKEFPNRSSNKEEIKMYLEFQGACSDCMNVFEEAWKEFEAWSKMGD